MSIAPFSAPPVPQDGERRRARIVLLIAAVGISAMLLAYAVSPGVRHAVGHAAHSVKHAVSHVFDPDNPSRARHSAHHRASPAAARRSRTAAARQRAHSRG